MSVTEASSYYDHLEQMSISDLLTNINKEDKSVPSSIERAIPQIEKLVAAIVDAMLSGGRLFYIGAGTSGRLGILDASEIPPTYGMPHGQVIGLIAGGDQAIRKAVENAEDDRQQAWKDLQQHAITSKDILIGIAASGRTPYVIGGLEDARKHGIVTGCITCNENSDVARHADYPVEVIVGPEFVTGSTRMKAGTAQKLVLNMISTTVMIKLGRVKGNKMVDMQLTNVKLVNRGIRMIMEETGVDEPTAEALLNEHRSVRKAIEQYQRHA
ncbi:MAG: N-acetylmuramic acid 6-phosphate etherase [Cyclobacteriaceae bacterium]|jgi:N-acetylmuramic acid 6-phosphate etherase|nr:N-acetylmuramic acid 6-phosphate etherase [Cyclobacteriaceae bacterium]